MTPNQMVLLLLVSMLATAAAHGHMTKPSPRAMAWAYATDQHMGSYRYDEPPFTVQNGPSLQSGYQYGPISFRCHDFAAGAPQTTLMAGEVLELEWQIQARHPGDCSLWVSYDDEKTAPETWIKLYDFVGCMDQSSMAEYLSTPSWTDPLALSTYSITLPDWLPSCDHCILRWEWITVQALSNIELYVTCADVTIVGTSEAVSTFLSKTSPVIDINNSDHLPADQGSYRRAYDGEKGAQYLVGPAVATYSGLPADAFPPPPPSPPLAVAHSPPQPSPPSADAPCDELQFTVDKTRLNGFISEEWCFSAIAVCSGGYDSDLKARCESLYVEPSVTNPPDPNLYVAGTCAGGCAECVYRQQPNGNWVCRADSSTFGCPVPSPLPPGAPAMPCSEMVATLTNVRDANEWCNTDAARRSPLECAKFYATLDSGQLKRCAYGPAGGTCTLSGQVCLLPPPALPPKATALPCSEMIEKLTNTRTLDPPEWCDTDPARRNPENCPKFYATTSEGGFQRCGYDPVGKRCRLNLGQICI
jgi:hypothetical protein